MPDHSSRPTAPRALDAAAVDAALRRMARQAEPPWLHGEVARRMVERLPIVRLQPDVIVDWWGHTGAGGALLAKACPRAQRLVVEPSEALAERSRAAAQAPWWSARRWRQGAIEVLCDDPAPARARLLWSNMMLHAVVDPLAEFGRWQRALAADGFVMFSCLGAGSLAGLRDLYRAHAWGEPAAAFVDMHDLGDMLVASGFADPVMDQEMLTLTWDSPQALLRELRSLGGNAAPSRWPALRTPRWREQLHDALRALAGPDGRLRLGFEIVYGHAFKAEPRVARGGETHIAVADLRASLHMSRGTPR
jgi:malonyl-CoA O-methyltransferase